MRLLDRLASALLELVRARIAERFTGSLSLTVNFNQGGITAAKFSVTNSFPLSE